MRTLAWLSLLLPALPLLGCGGECKCRLVTDAGTGRPFFWATATWWIPLLVILEVWRHVWRHVPLRYETDDWDIVFPIGMYTVGTFELAQALPADFLRAIPAVGVYASLAVWLLVALIGLRRLYRKGLRHGMHAPH